jgi:hypothetical protein
MEAFASSRASKKNEQIGQAFKLCCRISHVGAARPRPHNVGPPRSGTRHLPRSRWCRRLDASRCLLRLRPSRGIVGNLAGKLGCKLLRHATLLLTFRIIVIIRDENGLPETIEAGDRRTVKHSRSPCFRCDCILLQPDRDDIVYPQPCRPNKDRGKEEPDSVPVVQTLELAAMEHFDAILITHVPRLTAAKMHKGVGIKVIITYLVLLGGGVGWWRGPPIFFGPIYTICDDWSMTGRI